MIELLAGSLEKFVEFCVKFSNKKVNAKRQDVDDALRAVQIALNETQIYYALRDRGMPRNDEKEVRLSRYWSAASIPLRHIDPDFAERCEHKSLYWLNPDDWSDTKVGQYKIRLISVAKSVRALRGIGIKKFSVAKPKRTKDGGNLKH
jgi:hypothetical protein